MSRRAKIVAGLATVSLTVLAAPSLGAGWVPSPTPTLISDSPEGRSQVRVAVSSNGDAVAVWEQNDNTTGGSRVMASVRHNGSWGAPAQLEDGGGTSVQPFVVIDQNGFATAVWSRNDSAANPAKTISFATRPAGGAWSAAALVPNGGGGEVLSLAIAPNGAVTAAWQNGAGGVWAADKVAGATSFTSTQISASGGSPAVATGPSSQVAFGWDAGNVLKVKVRASDGTWAAASDENASIDDPDTPFTEDAAEPVLGFGADGALHAAWHEYADAGATTENVRTSSRTTGGLWTEHPDPLSTADRTTRLDGIAGDASGNVTLVWTQTTPIVGGGWNTRYFADTRVSGTWEAPFALTGASPGEGLRAPVLLRGSNGTFTALWGQDFQVKANRRTAAGAWLATPENISTTGVQGLAGAVDTTGPIAVWLRFYYDYANQIAHYPVETRTYDPNALASDTAGPVTTMTLPNKSYYLTSSLPLAWNAVDDIGTVTGSHSRYRDARWSGGYSAYTNWTVFAPGTSATYSSLAGRTYCFEVQSKDNSDNVGDWSSERCTATPVDDRIPIRTGAWTGINGTQFYRGTVMRSADSGATMTLSGAQGKRFALVVTKCPGCGKIRFSFRGQVIGTYSLNATTTKHKVVIGLTTLPAVQTGKVLVTVVSANGKRVEIDGILVGRV